MSDYYDRSRMTVREMINLLQTLDPDAKIEVATGECNCGDPGCADYVARPVLVGYNKGQNYDRAPVYVIRPNISYQLSGKFIRPGGRIPDVFMETDYKSVLEDIQGRRW